MPQRNAPGPGVPTISRNAGVLLAALAVQLILDGVSTSGILT